MRLMSACIILGSSHWANVDILLAVLLAQRRQMTLARRHFAHRADVIANNWFDVGPTSLVLQAQHMPT